MSSDLLAVLIAVGLGAAVVILGLKRNLSETTRSGLPRYGGPERATATLGLYEGEERPRRRPSRREQRWFVAVYLVWALFEAAVAVLSSHDTLIHAAMAGLLLLAVAVLLLRKTRDSSDEPAS
jgi:peptidoglycan/LPS O-acetylase OafA/YrhL